MSKCKQCGKCCHRGDFWQLSKHPILVQIYVLDEIRIEETGECLFLKDNECMIEKYLGRDAKPDVCKEYDCEVKYE